jgi:hypothetical protein
MRSSSGAGRGQGDEPFTDVQDDVEHGAPQRFSLSNYSSVLLEQTFGGVSEGGLEQLLHGTRRGHIRSRIVLPAA